MSPRIRNEFLGQQHRYATVAQSLLDDIEGGRYPVGTLLPTELELVAQFGVSRHTVREAIRQLQQVGLITRRKGVGTRVKAASAASRYVQSCASISDLLQYAKEVRLKVGPGISVTAVGDCASFLRCKEGQRWLRFDGMRHAKNVAEAICYTEVFIRYEFASIRDQISRSPGLICALIEKHFAERVHEIQQEIKAVRITAPIAKRLGVKAGSPGLSIVRYYLSLDDRPLEVALSIYPAERFTYSMRLRLDTSGE